MTVQLEFRFIKSCLEQDASVIISSKIHTGMFTAPKAAKAFENIYQRCLETGENYNIAEFQERFDINLDQYEATLSFDEYEEKLIKKYIEKKVRFGLSSAQRLIQDGDYGTLLKEFRHMEDLIQQVPAEANPAFLGNSAKFWDDYIERKNNPELSLGLTTRWQEFNQKTLGFQKGDLWVFVAKQGVGKTWLCTILAEDFWRKGHTVLFFEPEISINKIILRFHSVASHVNYTRLKTGNLTDVEEHQYQVFLKSIEQNDRLIFISTKHVKNEYQLERMITRYSADVVLVDSIYCLKTFTNVENKYTEIGETVKRLNNIAKKLDVPIICTTHFQRGGNRDDEIAYSQEIIRLADCAYGLIYDEQNPFQMFMKNLKMRDEAPFHFKIRWYIPNHEFDFMFETDEEGNRKCY